MCIKFKSFQIVNVYRNDLLEEKRSNNMIGLGEGKKVVPEAISYWT